MPQLDGGLFLTDGGMETTLIFHDGVELPCFASFPLLEDAGGAETMRAYFEPYLALAREHGAGFVLDTATWRANRDWGAQLGYSETALGEVNRTAVAFAERIRDAHEDAEAPIVINGCIGPRGDAYRADESMNAEEAERYHSAQIETLADTGVDMASALTLTNVEEAIGIARAARAVELPVVISFTVETDGRLPSGQPLADAIEQVDAETDAAPAYFMINCAHPTHFAGALEAGEPWVDRIRGLRANASARSHAELDESDELDVGDPAELAAQYRDLRGTLPNLNVVGGCCGTDHRHVAEIAGAWRLTG